MKKIKNRFLNFLSLVIAGKEFKNRRYAYLVEHEYLSEDVREEGIKQFNKCQRLFKLFPFFASDYFKELVVDN